MTCSNSVGNRMLQFFQAQTPVNLCWKATSTLKSPQVLGNIPSVPNTMIKGLCALAACTRTTSILWPIQVNVGQLNKIHGRYVRIVIAGIPCVKPIQSCLVIILKVGVQDLFTTWYLKDPELGDAFSYEPCFALNNESNQSPCQLKWNRWFL